MCYYTIAVLQKRVFVRLLVILYIIVNLYWKIQWGKFMFRFIIVFWKVKLEDYIVFQFFLYTNNYMWMTWDCICLCENTIIYKITAILSFSLLHQPTILKWHQKEEHKGECVYWPNENSFTSKYGFFSFFGLVHLKYGYLSIDWNSTPLIDAKM